MNGHAWRLPKRPLSKAEPDARGAEAVEKAMATTLHVEKRKARGGEITGLSGQRCHSPINPWERSLRYPSKFKRYIGRRSDDPANSGLQMAALPPGPDIRVRVLRPGMTRSGRSRRARAHGWHIGR